MKKLVGITSIWSVLVATAVYAGALYYVSSKRGNDSYSCQQARSFFTPKRTVTAAQQCLAPGDAIKVLD
jgi:hypothetical protein